MSTLPNTAGYTFGAALTWTQGEYGYLISEVESFPSIATVAPANQFLPNNGDRLGLVIINTSLNNIFVGLSNQVSSLFGILLTANGGSLTANVRQDLTLPTRAWFGFSPSGVPTTIYVLEIIGVKQLPPRTAPGF
jgi:hypothetical protein